MIDKDYFTLEEKYEAMLNLTYPIACPIEWYGVIEDLLSKIDKYRRDQGIYIEIVQIKEKFGGLRCYVSYHCDEHDLCQYSQALDIDIQTIEQYIKDAELMISSLEDKNKLNG